MRLAHLFTLSLALVLSACGFQLRGTGNFEFSLKELRFSSDDRLAPLASQLQERLRAQGVELTDSAEYSLHLGRETQSQRVVSFTAGTRSSEQMLTSTVDYEIRSGQLPALIRGQAEIQRAQSFNQNHVSASSEEARMLRDEMRNELVMQLMLRLQAIKPAQLEQLREAAQIKADAEAAAREAEQQRLQQEEKMFQIN
ncbi:LPS assembly lipoprotein LptE [Thiopseudomonas denitrificans]|uniref:LPS-assembly lipoprotein LptE n=1 Tax=Thiopseudomonas denitrificans TaxID=1501432 RepID=A0A4R6TVA6_9GAMM|nr:LPS assembly lipoprotein LptE [Thiopseudomonas denitrificans]TDQ35380.1 LPS-assembly lipoprotein [Thiopseudomonas denitrificans]